MTWLNICQGLMLLGWVGRLIQGLSISFVGRDKTEATGALGVCFTFIFSALSAAVIWKSGAVSTLFGGGP